MKKRFIILSLVVGLFAFTSTQAVAQTEPDKEETENYKYNIGAGAGFTTGYGLSFRYTPNKFGVQVNFAPYKDEDIKRYSAGLTFMYKLVESKRTSFYLYQGNHYYYNNEPSFYYEPYGPYGPYNPHYYENGRIEESYVNNGIGFGVEIIILKRIGFNLMTGYAFYENFEELNLTIETALYYKF